MDNDIHARFQRMLLGDPEPEPQPQFDPQPEPELAQKPEAEPEQKSLVPPPPALQTEASKCHDEEKTPFSQPFLPPRQKPSPPPPKLPTQPTRHHVDANANFASSPPPAATQPPPPSTASKHFQTQPPSMISIIQDQWVRLCDYFQRVQCANSSEERTRLVRELGIVEECLNTILDVLLTDRKLLVSTQLLHTHMSIFGEPLHGSELGVPTPTSAEPQEGETGKAVPPSGSVSNAHLCSSGIVNAATTTNTATVTTGLSPASGFLLDGALTSLPPCYRFLFADAHRDDLLSSGESEAEFGGVSVCGDFPPPKQEQLKHGNTVRETAAAATVTRTEKPFDEPSPIGSIFLLTLCQYAKQDEPPGVRSIILEFLVRLLQEADLPTDRAAYPAGDPVLSLLQLNPPLLIVPLLDMLRKVSKALDPSSTTMRHGSTPMSSSLSYPWTGKGWNEDEEDGTFLQDAGRTQFVIFLSSLAEKMERVPALANFFVVEDGVDGERNLFVLLDALLPYLTHDCSAPGWTHRRDTCRYALSAVVSLAKCPDPWIQDLVGKEDRVASRTLMAARTTLLTLCKIPDNDDSATQLLFLRDVLRFWATLTTMSPAVAGDLRLTALVEKEFYFQTLVPLLQSSDTHVYSAACLVATQMLRELNGNAPGLTRGLANALLATSIRKSSGRIIPHANYYDSVVTDTEGDGHAKGSAKAKKTSGATTLGQREEAAAMRLQMHPTTSFFLYYIVPHLSSNPYMSADEQENSALVGYATTRWSAVKATLVLVQALAENAPEVFLREVFLMDMNSLADVLRKGRQSATIATAAVVAMRTTAPASSSSGGAAAMGSVADDGRPANIEIWSTADAPPHLNVKECFVKELHETTAASVSLGLHAERIGEAVLTRLLRTEGNMSIDALRVRQEVMSAMTEINTSGVIALGSTGNAAAPTQDTAAAAPHADNCWSHAGVQRSPLTVALCEMFQHLDATPYTVSSLVADLIVSLCVQPDPRVIYTLLDPTNGPLKTALCQLRDILQHRIHTKGADVMLAQTEAKKGASGAAGTPGGTSLSSPPLAGASAPPTTTSVSLLILYDTLLQHWEEFMSEQQASSVPRDETGGSLPTKAIGAGFPVESLRGAIESNSNVLHACVYLEYLLVHLDAVIRYSALSQNLMCLRTSF